MRLLYVETWSSADLIDVQMTVIYKVRSRDQLRNGWSLCIAVFGVPGLLSVRSSVIRGSEGEVSRNAVCNDCQC